MAGKQIVRTFLGACIASALSIGAVGTAHAIKYVGSFDPLYDNTGPDTTYHGAYGFRGKAEFEISADCLGLSSVFDDANTYYVTAGFSSGRSSCTSISVLSASLTIYQVDSLYYGESTDYAIQTTNDMTGDVLTLAQAYGIVVKNGQINGIVTNYFGGVDFQLDPLPINESTSPADPFSETLWMRFFDKRISLGSEDESRALFGPGQDPVTVCNTQPSGTTCGTGGFVSNESGPITFREVPEPDSLALVALALGAGAALARRRRNESGASRA
jgi:hypothetical protein